MDDPTSSPERRCIDEHVQNHNRPPQPLIYMLPDELLPECASARTDAADICTLRLTSQRFAAVGATRLSTFFTSLCIESTPQSLARFQAICQHPIFSKGIRFVLYWGLTFRSEVAELEEYRELKRIEDIVDNYRLPDSVVQSAHLDHKLRCRQQKQILDRGLDIAKMRTYLPLLPKLMYLVSDLSTEELGHALNYPISLKHMESNMDSEASWNLRRYRSVENEVRSRLYMADLDLDPGFQALVRFPLLKVMTSMSTWQQPVFLHIWLSRNMIESQELQHTIDSNDFKYGMRCVKHLLIACQSSETTPSKSNGNVAHTVRRIADCASNVHSLSLHAEEVDDSWEVLMRCHLPKLSELFVFDTFVFRPRGRSSSSVPHITSVNPIKAFLLRHRDTLETVLLWHLLGVSSKEGPEKKFSCASPTEIGTMRRLLMMELPRLRYCSIKIELPDSDGEAPWPHEFGPTGSEVDFIPLYRTSTVYRRLLHDVRAEAHGRFRPKSLQVADTDKAVNFGFYRDLHYPQQEIVPPFDEPQTDYERYGIARSA